MQSRNAQLNNIQLKTIRLRALGLMFVLATSQLSHTCLAQDRTKLAVKAPVSVSDIERQRFSFSSDLVDAALDRLKHKVKYDGRYIPIAYPGGDVPKGIGVCTDVIIRSYRKLGIDLQEKVHRDMLNNFSQYPNLAKWGRSRPDPNIDHRRVLNLKVFFQRHGAALPISSDSNDYLPGDLVTWDMRPGMPHIGIVTHQVSRDKTRPLIVHNIGKGPKLEDILFKLKITGHYRYQPGLQFNPALQYLAQTNQVQR